MKETFGSRGRAHDKVEKFPDLKKTSIIFDNQRYRCVKHPDHLYLRSYSRLFRPYTQITDRPLDVGDIFISTITIRAESKRGGSKRGLLLDAVAHVIIIQRVIAVHRVVYLPSPCYGKLHMCRAIYIYIGLYNRIGHRLAFGN